MGAFVSCARKHFLIESSYSPGSNALLASFQSAHRKMEAAIAHLDAIIPVDVPNMRELSAARLRLSQANLARKRISREVYDQVIERVTVSNAEAVRDLQRRELELFQLTSELVRTWSLKEVQQNWAGYRGASLVVREQLRMIVAAERSILYPLLTGKAVKDPKEESRR